MVRLWGALLFMVMAASSVWAQQRAPLRLEVTKGVVEPLPFAAPSFVPESPQAAKLATDITQVIINDLVNSGLFREIPRTSHIGRVTSFEAPVRFADWTPIDAQALITGSVATTNDGRVVVKFRLWDVFANKQLGEGQQFAGPVDGWRRMAHKVADQVYTRLTGEAGYFDSRVAFISETGPKNARRKRLAVMDQDGANVRYLTQDNAIVLAPRWSPNGSQIIYTSYETGRPQVVLMDVRSLQKRSLGDLGQVSFAPRFSPDGTSVVMSLTNGTNTDIYSVDLRNGQRRQLTNTPAIETAPSYSPDGGSIVYESDRSGSPQLYVMSANGGEGRRISGGDGSYGTPVWSPRGDLIAFTKILKGQFHIGAMRVDGTSERLLTTSFLDEGPSWSPNGRVITFFRETRGESGAPAIYAIDIARRQSERRIPTPGFASDPSWGPLLP